MNNCIEFQTCRSEWGCGTCKVFCALPLIMHSHASITTHICILLDTMRCLILPTEFSFSKSNSNHFPWVDIASWQTCGPYPLIKIDMRFQPNESNVIILLSTFICRMHDELVDIDYCAILTLSVEYTKQNRHRYSANSIGTAVCGFYMGEKNDNLFIFLHGSARALQCGFLRFVPLLWISNVDQKLKTHSTTHTFDVNVPVKTNRGLMIEPPHFHSYGTSSFSLELNPRVAFNSIILEALYKLFR